MKPTYVFLLLSGCLMVGLTSLSFHVFSQEADLRKTDHTLSLQFGMNKIKDENLHAKVSKGALTEFSYGFEKATKAWQQFHFTLGYSRLKTEIEDVSKTANLRLHTDYSWSYPLVRKHRFNYYLGPEGSISYNVCYFPNWDESHLYWASNFSVGVRNSFSVSLKDERKWVSFLSFPLFSMFSRPELYRLYKIDETDGGGIMSNINSDLTPGHLTNVFFLKFQTEYRFPVFKSKTQAFTYSLEFNRVKHNDGNLFLQELHQIGIRFFL
jgi:hypothetical protein